MKTSHISWTDATFNPWWGCTKVSPACTFCYAETWANRHGVAWGKDSARRFFGDKHWNEPLKWNRKAEVAGQPLFVFCASMADVFEYLPNTEGQKMDSARQQLWRLIEDTPWLVWLLLTKRPENMLRMTPARWLEGWPKNIIPMATVEDQKRADERIPHLLSVPASMFGLSMEPLFGLVNLPQSFLNLGRRAWLITGGESGAEARPSHTEWYRHLRTQASAHDIPFHFKQWGEWAPGSVPANQSHRIVFLDGSSCVPGNPSAEQRNLWNELRPEVVARVGKKAAGRLLDGRIWDERPLVHVPTQANCQSR